MSVDAGLKLMKVISRGEDGSWKRVSVSGGRMDKRVGESAGSISIPFDSKGVLRVREPGVSRKEGFRGILDFSST